METRNLFFIVLFIGILSSCNDAIEIAQPGRLPAEVAFQSVDDLESGLLGLYALYDTSQEIQFNSVFADEVAIGFDNGGQGLGDGEYGFVLNPNSATPNRIWVDSYAAINLATKIIEASALVEFETNEQSRLNNVLGQAHALRAFAHFQIQSYFSTDYSDSSALGGILLDFIPTIDQSLPRNTNAEVFGLIELDLATAEGLLSTESDATFVSQDFITALRARMAAYRGQYTLANTYATELLARYPLANRAQYVAMFEDADNTEVIFKLERTASDRYNIQGPSNGAAGGWAGANYAFVNATLAGSPYYEMGRAVFNLLDPADIRFDVNVDASSIISPDYQNDPDYRNNDILVISKYPGSEGIPLMNDLKVFRSSEMLLIKAEALADAGNINGASNSTAALIKELRDARFGSDQPLPSYSDAAAAFGAILDERRIELVFEGHRWKDLKRLGQRSNRGISRDPLDCAINGACMLPASDYRFTMPIPIIELNPNTAIRDQQNPGY